MTKTIRLPGDVLEQMRPLMIEKKVDFNNFVLAAIKNYIQVIKNQDGIEASYGAWQESPHPELKDGVDKYVRHMRRGRAA
jgi:hypothetical protein